jgi:peptide/nickel transport system substrate-binding protein
MKVPGTSGNKLSSVLFALTVITLLWLPACSRQAAVVPVVEILPTKAASTRDTRDTLRLVFWTAPTILNPHLSANTIDLGASRIAYEPLATFTEEGTLVPFLAKEIPSLENGGLSSDGRSVTWKLKEGVQWADGHPFTADDVLFTYEFISNPEVGAAWAGFYEGIDSVEVIDPYTVRVNFIDVNPAWSLPFVGRWGMILPRRLFEAYNGANAQEAPANQYPVGTGPYYVVENAPQETLFLGDDLVQTNKIVFEPNPYFREPGKPFFNRIIVEGGGTAQEAARLVLGSGEVDLALDLLFFEGLKQLEAQGKGKLVVTYGSRVEQLALNRTDPTQETETGERSSLQFEHPFFDDKRVRQAFNLAIDRERIATLYGLAGRPTSNNLVAPSLYVSTNTSYRFDLEQAATLLDEAGWFDTNRDGIRDRNGRNMKVVYLTVIDPLVQEVQKIIKENLESIGIEVELRPVEASIFYSPVESPGSALLFYADVEQYSIENLSPDPGSYMVFWTCSQIPQQENSWLAGLNLGRWCNPEYDELYRRSTIELDPEKRRQLFIEMNDLMIEDVAIIPLVHLAEISAVANTIEGTAPNPWDSLLWNIKDWRRVLP